MTRNPNAGDGGPVRDGQQFAAGAPRISGICPIRTPTVVPYSQGRCIPDRRFGVAPKLVRNANVPGFDCTKWRVWLEKRLSGDP